MAAIGIPYHNFVQEWFDRYEMADFDKFIYPWISFNAWLGQRTSLNTDRQMIEWFKREYQSESLEDIEADSDAKSAVEWFVSNGVMDMKTGEMHEPENPTDFDGIVEVLHQVRCNLVHGSKSRDASIDREIVRHATAILDAIYPPILSEYRRFHTDLQHARWDAVKGGS